MNKLIHLAMAGCLAMGSVAMGQGTTRPAVDGSAPADRASGRDPAAAPTAEGAARDRLPDSNTLPPVATNVEASAAAMQQQLANIAKQPDLAPDKLFVLGAAMGNQWEIAYSRIVAERATNNEVKAAAQHIIDDHTAAQAKLKPVADKMNLTLPTALPPEKQQKLQIFRAMSVDQLEKNYVVNAKGAHAKDISCYSDHGKLTQNADLKAYIDQTLPKLQQHAQHIQTAAAAKGVPSDLAGAGQPKVGGQMPTGRTE